MPIPAGLQAAFDHAVTDADTALALGSGDVPVLATPRVLALAERATVAAVADALADGATTVGTRVELDHLLACPVGATVRVTAVLERVDGRRLEFAVELRERDRLAASGRVIRMVVDRSRFLEATRRRAG